MNKTARFLSVAAVAAFAAFGAHADEADGSQFALKFDTNRTALKWLQKLLSKPAPTTWSPQARVW